jgi:hypothetical protein
MRKTLAVLVLVAALSSCGSGNNEAPAATTCDTCAVAGDTTTSEVTVDSTAAVDSAVAK